MRYQLLSVLAWCSISVAFGDIYQVHERAVLSSRSPRQAERLAHDVILPLKVYLKQSNIDEGAAHLMEISNPLSPKYAQHWSPEEVAEFFEPDAAKLDSIRDWMNRTNISWDRVRYSRHRGTLSFMASVAEAEDLLQTRFNSYHDSASDSRSIGCDEYSLPQHLRDSIDFVSPTIPLEPSRKQSERIRIQRRDGKPRIRPFAAAATNDLANCPQGVSPECIATLYKIPAFQGTPNPNNSMGIFNAAEGGENETYSQSDLNSFFATYATKIPNGTHPIAAAVGGATVETDDPTQEGGEAMLDYSMAFPIIYPQTITAFVNQDDFHPPIDGTDANVLGRGVEAFLDAIDGSYCHDTGASNNTSLDCGVYQPTNVISFSYEHSEIDINYNYAIRVCNEFMKLGLQGVTILAASGDYGTGLQCLGTIDRRAFDPEWISTCPWVTSVGGTQLNPGADVTRPNAEVGWFISEEFGGSGGGFSNYYPMPDYQNSSVAGYLADANLSFSSYSQFVQMAGNRSQIGAGTNGTFNRAGRAFPDVSALAENLAIYYGSSTNLLDGTSAATPIWGAIITRINEERLAAGKNTVGFVNPTLYQNPSVLNDITSGQNRANCGPDGFPAIEGWDAVTGLGSPDYGKLLDLFMSLP